MKILPPVAVVALSLIAATETSAADSSPGREAFRAIYQELVEIDSSSDTGSCTKVVRAAESRLKAAGFSSDEVHVLIPDGKPDDGNIVARIRSKSANGARNPKKGVLLLAHIDVVNAKREDWERDPFRLVEENGYFYGRGASDDKAMAAVFLDLMIRLKQQSSFRPRRDLVLALTCGEETSNRVNGVDFLLQNHRELIDADFALNEGAGGLLSPQGTPLSLEIQAGEKIHQVFALEVTNPGGHSSRPVPDNAIYRLAVPHGGHPRRVGREGPGQGFESQVARRPEALDLDRMAIGRDLHEQGAGRGHARDLRREHHVGRLDGPRSRVVATVIGVVAGTERGAPGRHHSTDGQAPLHQGTARGGHTLPYQHRFEFVEVAPHHQHRFLVEIVQRRRYAHDMAAGRQPRDRVGHGLAVDQHARAGRQPYDLERATVHGD